MRIILNYNGSISEDNGGRHQEKLPGVQVQEDRETTNVRDIEAAPQRTTQMRRINPINPEKGTPILSC